VRTILHIDDSLLSLRAGETVLSQRLGHQVRQARSGEEGLAAVKESVPDLIILDIVMPGMDGFETLKALKADPATRGIPVLMCTGRTDEKELARAKRLGAAGCLSKPLKDEEAVRTAIAEALAA